MKWKIFVASAKVEKPLSQLHLQKCLGSCGAREKKNMDIDPKSLHKPLGLDDRAIDFMGQNCLGCSMDFRLQHLQVNLLFCGPPERLGCLNLCCLRMDG